MRMEPARFACAAARARINRDPLPHRDTSHSAPHHMTKAKLRAELEPARASRAAANTRATELARQMEKLAAELRDVRAKADKQQQLVGDCYAQLLPHKHGG